MPRESVESVPVAIVGMACRLPGADDLDEYWKLLIEGRSAVAPLPPERLDEKLYYDARVGTRGKTYSRLGAIISSREFDRNKCPINEALARAVDPAHLLMCESAATALRHAGLNPFDLPHSLRNTGVYIGHAQGSELGGQYTYGTCIEHAAQFLYESEHFQTLPPQQQQRVVVDLIQDVRGRCPRRTPEARDVAASMVAGTVSKAFQLTGPFVAINSACASSLQAILLAVRALQTGRIDMAIAGGASDCKSDSLVLFSYAQAVSATGSRPFDAEADGLICGEGYAAIVLKTLSRALADGDRVLAVIRGLGVSSDGKGRSLWAPRKEGQIKAMERAYRCGVDISQLQYVEAHSTATQLGDATELNTLVQILSKHLPRGKRIPITSVKANIGHALETAGVAGVIKAVLCMQQGMVPPAINIRRLNSNIDWDQAPIFVPTSPVPWSAPEEGHPRRAGVNAFGIGGLNMHVVIDEFTESVRRLVDVPRQQRGPSEAFAEINQEYGGAVPSRSQDAIAVVGMGCVLPGASSIDQFWQLLRTGRDPKSHVTDDRWLTSLSYKPDSREAYHSSATLGGFITDFRYDWRQHKIPPKQIAQADPLQFMLLDAADQALADAGYDQKAMDPSGVGVVVGTEFGGDFSFQLQMGLRLPDMERVIQQSLARLNVTPEQRRVICQEFAQSLLSKWPALIDETGSFSTSSLASRLAKTRNWMGGAAAIDAGECSGLSALALSVDMLLAHDCDMTLCAAGQRRMGLPEYECLSIAGLSATDPEPYSPLDVRGSGYVPAEGVGVLLLKRLSDAQRDGDQIHAVIRGIGAAHEGSTESSLRAAVARSLEDAGCDPGEIALLELDAQTQEMAAAQVQAVAAMHGGQSRREPLLISSVTGHVGFTQGASGIVSFIKAALEINHGEVPATVGLEIPAPFIVRHAAALKAVCQATAIRPDAEQQSLAAVAACSRGLSYHVVLQQGSAARSVVDTPQATQATNSVAEPGKAKAKLPTAVDSQRDAPASLDPVELEAFLINFVVEQTGYPPEVVELDADLEADLGIDSIKKAQLFGELQEFFDVTAAGNLTLDDFPTLRHVVEFLASSSTLHAVDSNGPSPSDAPPRAHDATESVAAEQGRGGKRDQDRSASATADIPPTRSASISSPRDVRWRIERIGAATLEDLKCILREAVSSGASSISNRARFRQADHVRLALVVDGPETLHVKLQRIRPHLEGFGPQTHWDRHGIFCREMLPHSRPKIAFLFPGQGSQYVGMMRELAQESAAAAAALENADTLLTKLGLATFEQLAWNSDGGLGTDFFATQLSMLVADVVVDAAIRDLGVQPDVVAGHSYGEYAALVEAGAWDLEQAIKVTRARCEGIESCRAAQGGMLATDASPQEIHEIVRQLRQPVYVANQNGPHQTVLGGSLAILAELEPLLLAASFQARVLDVPCPFHTPLMRGALEPLELALQAAEIKSPHTTTFSGVTNHAVYGPEQVRANLLAHMTSPLNYAELVQRIAGVEPTVFVEVGPQQTLSQLHRSIFADSDTAIEVVACDHPQRHGIEQLYHALALLECTGAVMGMGIEASARLGGGSLPGIVRFDATQRRRQRMRQQALSPSPRLASSDASAKEASAEEMPDRLPAPSSRSDVAIPTQADAGVITPRPTSLPDTVEVAESIRSRAASAEDSAKTPLNTTELETFLINFVVEQTGYPPEVVELDADLEADLGIDSIKKAQLFGELQEYFDATPTEGLTLDDFPTLRHVVEFLAKHSPTEAVDTATSQGDDDLGGALVQSQLGHSPASVDIPNGHGATAHEIESDRFGAAPAIATAEPVARQERDIEPIPTLQLQGTPYEMGRQHGQALKDQIRATLHRVADLTTDSLEELPVPLHAFSEPQRFFDARQLSELQGIAEAVEVPLGNLVGLNLTLSTELGSCSAQFASKRSSTTGTIWHGMWDGLPLTSSFCECLQPLVLVREPDSGIPHAVVTFAGCVFGIGGLNALGVGITAGSLRQDLADRSEMVGQRQAMLLPTVLQTARDIPSVIASLRAAPASRPWNLVLSHSAEDRVCYVQYDGQSLETNQDEEVIAENHGFYQAASPEVSSPLRRRRLEQGLASHAAPEDLLASLKDFADSAEPQLGLVMDLQHGDIWIGVTGTAGATSYQSCRIRVGPLLTPPPGNEAVDEVSQSALGVDSARDSFFANLPEQTEDDLPIQRFVMRTVSVPWPADCPETAPLHGTALVVGDGPVADALQQQLAEFSPVIRRLNLGDSIEDAVDTMERMWQQQPVPHLFLATSRDYEGIDRNDPSAWNRVYQRRVLFPYFFVQRWMQLACAANMLDRCSLVAVTDLGGDFGFSGNVAAPECGALTGLIKALSLEYRVMRGHDSLRVKAIDAPLLEHADTLAYCILRELAAATPDYEVSFVNGVRHLQVAVPRDAVPRDATSRDFAARRPAGIRPGAVWVITGGARGITAECARELGRRFGLKLQLVGMTALCIEPTWRDLDDRQREELRTRTMRDAHQSGRNLNAAWEQIEKQLEIDQTLRALESEGVQATYHSCDVSDREALSEVLYRIRQDSGPIEGIVHGAGFEHSCRFENKTREDCLATLGAKVQGAYNLMTLTHSDPIRHFIGFGSISGRIGSNGQADYCAASDMLCKLVAWYRLQRPSCHAVAFHWHGWDEVGMAKRPETQATLEATAGIKVMPPRLGVRHFLRELYAGCSDGEVLVTDWNYHQRFYHENVRDLATDFESGKLAEFPVWGRRLARRHVLRVTEAPIDDRPSDTVSSRGEAIILGDNPDARALCDRLQRLGATVHVLPVLGGASQVVAALEDAWNKCPAHRLFVMTARGAEPSPPTQQESLQRLTEWSVYLPYLVVQRWLQLVSELDASTPATLVAATSLGGDFGFAKRPELPQGGALAGLLKSIHLENVRSQHHRLRVKVVDSPASESPAELASAICRELASNASDLEVAWSQRRRRVVECVAQPITDLPITDLPSGDLPSGGTWVVTGGARGITAYIAYELGRRFGLKLHLLGKSPAPREDSPWRHCDRDELKALKRSMVREALAAHRSPEDDWGKVRRDMEICNSLRRFRNAGIQASYHACDVADPVALASVLDEIRRIDGPVDGILHGAGYAKPARLQQQTEPRIRRTMAPKIEGTLALMELTKQDPLRFFLALGSLSGRFGGNGLGDYAAANDMMAKLCGSFRHQRPDCRVTCFHFQSWDQIGMAMFADGVDINKSVLRMDFIPPVEGVDHICDELRAGLPEAEVLVTDGRFQKLFYARDSAAVQPSAEVARSSHVAAPSPLIRSIEPTGTGELVGRLEFDPATDVFLTEHCLRDKPILPAVLGLEAVCEAASLWPGSSEVTELRQIEIVNGLVFQDRQPVKAKIVCSQQEDALDCVLSSEHRDRKGRLVDGERIHVKAKVRLGPPQDGPHPTPARKPPAGWHDHVYPDRGILVHGPSLRYLREVSYDRDGGWGKVDTPAPAELAGRRQTTGWILPASVLDACLVACGGYVYVKFGGAIEIPEAFERIGLLRNPLPNERCAVRWNLLHRDERQSRFDFVLYGEDDTPLVVVDGYRTIRLGAS